jgi:hypothetical protein
MKFRWTITPPQHLLVESLSVNPGRNIQHSTFNAQPRRNEGPEFEQKPTKLTKEGRKQETADLRFLCDLLFKIRWFVRAAESSLGVEGWELKVECAFGFGNSRREL